MTSTMGKFALLLVAAGGLSIAALSPASVEAGAIHGDSTLAAANSGSGIVRVVCERSFSNLWSCNDDLGVRDRRDVRVQDRRVQSLNRYASHPCDHSYETARDGSRCGNRAADKRPGGR